MTQTTTGRLMILAAFAMLAGLVGTEMAGLTSWEDVKHVDFLGKMLLHLATVISAAVGGKLLPAPR
jgi:hypothetical protein